MEPKELAELCIDTYKAMQKEEELTALISFIISGKYPTTTILEIGAGHLGTAWLWQHLEGNITLISIDLPGGPFGGGPDALDRERLENWLDKDKNTYLALLDSHLDSTLAEVKDTLKDTPVDILFIDGDHSYDGVKKDYEMYSPLVKQGGLIIFHDVCEHAAETKCEVKRFWDEIKVGKNYKEFISEPKTWGGISVIVNG